MTGGAWALKWVWLVVQEVVGLDFDVEWIPCLVIPPVVDAAIVLRVKVALVWVGCSVELEVL